MKPKLKIQQMLLGVVIAKKEKQNWKEITKTKLNFDVEVCPCCKTGRMIRVHSFQAHAPPASINIKVLTNKKTVC